MILDFSNLSENRKYKVMSNTIFPRPIAWISTEENGVINLAPFSYFAPISTEPPCVIVSIANKEDSDEPKDTFANIIKHKVCTINFAHKEFLDNLKNSAEELPKDISECDKYNIKMQKVLENYPPIVKNIHSALFCEFKQFVDLEGRYKPIILEIKHAFFQDEFIDEKLNIKLQNIGRVGMQFLVECERVE